MQNCDLALWPKQAVGCTHWLLGISGHVLSGKGLEIKFSSWLWVCFCAQMGHQMSSMTSMAYWLESPIGQNCLPSLRTWRDHQLSSKDRQSHWLGYLLRCSYKQECSLLRSEFWLLSDPQSLNPRDNSFIPWDETQVSLLESVLQHWGSWISPLGSLFPLEKP